MPKLGFFSHDAAQMKIDPLSLFSVPLIIGEPLWLSGRASDCGARGPGFEPHDRRVVSLSKTL